VVGLKCVVVVVLYYLVRKHLEHKEPHFTKPEIAAMLMNAGVRAKFAKNFDFCIGLSCANANRVEIFCKKDSIKDLNFQTSSDTAKFLHEIEKELRRQPNAKKSSAEYGIFKKVCASCKVSKA
jgi:hypothetical protein